VHLCGGFRVGKLADKDRHWLAGALLLDSDYFADNASSIPKEFWWRFRMNKELFMRIVFFVRKYDNYFICKTTGLCRFSLVQKYTLVYCVCISSRCCR
jgi:hypothetical protein